MSLDKAIKSGKEKRKCYRKACRNHSPCPACKINRLHKNKKREPIFDNVEIMRIIQESKKGKD